MSALLEIAERCVYVFLGGILAATGALYAYVGVLVTTL